MVESLDASDESEYCDSSDEEDEGDTGNTDESMALTKEGIERNYNLLETSTKTDPPAVLLSELRTKYPEAFTPYSEALLASVLEENSLGFQLTAFQVPSLHFSMEWDKFSVAANIHNSIYHLNKKMNFS